MSAIYLFSEALTTHQICAMHRLGPGYKVSSKIIKVLSFKINCLLQFLLFKLHLLFVFV